MRSLRRLLHTARRRTTRPAGATLNADEVLALTVARCPEVPKARRTSAHPCHRIVSTQPDLPSQWQVPEPWAGNLTSARIVFLSSNPSIDRPEDHPDPGQAEDYPRGDWDDASIAGFLTRRFDPTSGGASADARFKCRNGEWSANKVRFWAAVQDRASELLNRPGDPNIDYVMTEVVHCKSQQEIGVAQAADHCAAMHLDRILKASPAPLTVVMGAKARDRVKEVWRLPEGFGRRATVGRDEQVNLVVRNLGGRTRAVIFLWHPTGMETPRDLQGTYPRLLPLLQRLIRGAVSPDAIAGIDWNR